MVYNYAFNASLEFGSGYKRGGWISSLESIVVNENVHEIGIFFHEGTNFADALINYPRSKPIFSKVDTFRIYIFISRSMIYIIGRENSTICDQRW
jgi:hypothetical protein